MEKEGNMIYLYISIITIIMLSIGAMYNIADLDTLTKPYSQIISENPSMAIKLMATSVIGIVLITFIAKYFFENDMLDRDYVDIILDKDFK